MESDLRDGCATQIYTPPCTCWNVVVDYDVNRIYITSWNRAIARIQLLKAVTLNEATAAAHTNTECGRCVCNGKA